MSCTHFFAWLLCLPLWAACVVGAPIVDDDQAGFGADTLECNPPPSCEPRRLPRLELPPQTPLDLQRCAGQALCAPARASSDDAAPVDSATQCAGEPVDALPLAAECARQVLRAPQGVSELSYEGLRWTNVDLTVEATAPLRISLKGPELRAVAMHLRGPVELHVQDAQVTDLRVFGARSAAGEPSVSLVSVEASQVRVGDLERPFQGTLQVRASKLHVIELHVNELDLESSRLDVGIVDARGLSAADVALVQLEVRTEHGVFTEFETRETRLQLCEYASLIGGRLDTSVLEACPGTLVRVYASSVASSTLDGAFLADDSNFENDLFGATQSSRLISYQSRVTSTSLCGQLDLLALDGSSKVKCTGCDRSFEASPRACEWPRAPNTDSPLQANFCAALSRGRSLPMCSPEVPARTRQR